MDIDDLEAMLAAAETPEQLAEIERLIAIRGGLVVASLPEVAEILGVGVSTLWLWRSYPEPMPGTQGAWNIRDINEWNERRKAKKGGDDDQANQRLQIEVEALRTAVALKECQYRDMARDLLAVEAAAAMVPTLCAEVEGYLDTIPGLIESLTPENVKPHVMETAVQQVALIKRFLRGKFEGMKERFNSGHTGK